MIPDFYMFPAGRELDLHFAQVIGYRLDMDKNGFYRLTNSPGVRRDPLICSGSKAEVWDRLWEVYRIPHFSVDPAELLALVKPGMRLDVHHSLNPQTPGWEVNAVLTDEIGYDSRYGETFELAVLRALMFATEIEKDSRP